IGQDVALILMEVEPEAGAPSERARQLELGVDHPEPRGQAGLRGADRLRRALPLVPPVPGEAREVVVDHALVVALLGLGIEGGEFLGRGPRGRGPQRDSRRDHRAHHERGRADRTRPPQDTALRSAARSRSNFSSRLTKARARRVISAKWPAAASAGSASEAPRPMPIAPARRKETKLSGSVPAAASIGT